MAEREYYDPRTGKVWRIDRNGNYWPVQSARDTNRRALLNTHEEPEEPPEEPGKPVEPPGKPVEPPGKPEKPTPRPEVGVLGGWQWAKIEADKMAAQARLEFDYAIMENIQKPTMQSQNKLRAAQEKLTYAQEEVTRATAQLEREKFGLDKEKFGLDKEKFGVNTAMDLWKQRQEQQARKSNALGYSDVEELEGLDLPQLPRGYMPNDVEATRKDSQLREMWKWGQMTKAASGSAPGREAWVRRWGDEGGRLFDYGKYANFSLDTTPTDAVVGQLAGPGKGAYETSPEEKARGIWQWGANVKQARGGNLPSREEYAARFGEEGGALYDQAMRTGTSDVNQFLARNPGWTGRVIGEGDYSYRPTPGQAPPSPSMAPPNQPPTPGRQQGPPGYDLNNPEPNPIQIGPPGNYSDLYPPTDEQPAKWDYAGASGQRKWQDAFKGRY